MGDPFSGPINRQTVDLSQLDRLIKLDSSAIKKQGDGFTTDVGMTFRSGLNRVVGSGKSVDDVKSNQQTLATLLLYIKKNTSEDVYKEVLKSTTHLDGDNKSMTMAQRLQRGTYVSSQLVSQLKYATGLALDKFDEVYQRQQKFMPDNLRAIDKFVGRETEDPTIGNVIADTIGEIKDKIVGKTDPPFVKMVEDICREGTEEFPATDNQNTEIWKTVSRYLLGQGEQKAVYVPKDLDMHLKNAATKCAREGKVVSEDELKEATRKWLSSTTVMPRFVDATNARIVTMLTPRQFAQALEKWPEQAGKPELQEAANWLAAKVRPIGDEGYGEVGLLDKIKTLVGGKQGDGRDPGKMYDDMFKELRDNFAATTPPPELSPKERRAWIEEQTQGDFGKFREMMFHPHQFDENDIAALMGASTEKLVLLYKQDLDALNAEELREKSAGEQKLLDAMPRELFPNLRGAKDILGAEDGFQKLGMPGTPKEFLKALVVDCVVRCEKERLAEVDQEFDMNRDNRLAILGRVYQQGTEAKLAEMLAPIDTAADFHRELEQLRKEPGGLAGLPPETLARLDKMADNLSDCRRALTDYGTQVLERFDDRNDATEALGRTASDLRALVTAYRKESGHTERAMVAIRANDEKLAKVMQSIEREMRGESTLDRLPDATWATPRANENLAIFPGLKLLVIDMGAPRINQNTPRDTVPSLIRDLVHPLGGQDDGWKDIAPGLAVLDTYATLENTRTGLGADGLQSLSDGDLEALRDEFEQALQSAGPLTQSIELIRERYLGGDDVQLERLGRMLDAAVGDVTIGGQRILDEIKAELQKRTPPDDLPRLPDIPWARDALKDKLESFPSLHKLAFDTAPEKTGDLKKTSTLSGLIRDLVHTPFKQSLATQYDTRDRGQTQALNQRLKTLDTGWKDIEGRLAPLDRFAELQKEVKELGAAGLKALPPEKRDQLRARAQDAIDATPRLSQAINVALFRYEGAETVPIGTARDALDDAARRMRSDAEVILQALDGRPTPPPPPEIVPPQASSVQTDAPLAKGPINPFDDEPDQPSTSPTTATQRQSFNPFDDEPDQPSTSPTTTTQRQSFNPFDDEPDQPSTDPITTTQRQSTNPFDETDQLSTNPFDDEITSPSLVWEKPSLTERLSGYPTIDELANKVGFTRNSTGSLSGMVNILVVDPEIGRINEKYARDQDVLARRHERLGREWAPIGQKLEVLDNFAEIRTTAERLGEDGLSRLSPDDRAEMRRRTQEAVDTSSTLNTSLVAMLDTFPDTPTAGFKIDDMTRAIDGTRRGIVSEGRAILALLDRTDNAVR